ncbi:hypothetical protein VNO77_13511 [Canavalia gladiata]|uniref:Uncharacterized protein n=1 Tax=Canavalia gladiata TaxID=3824 RepID=A0AAN9QQK6_CANGL
MVGIPLVCNYCITLEWLQQWHGGRDGMGHWVLSFVVGWLECVGVALSFGCGCFLAHYLDEQKDALGTMASYKPRFYRIAMDDSNVHSSEQIIA